MTTNNLGLNQKPVSTNTPSYNTAQNNQNSNSFSYSFYPRSPKMQELVAKSEAIRAAEINATE